MNLPLSTNRTSSRELAVLILLAGLFAFRAMAVASPTESSRRYINTWLLAGVFGSESKPEEAFARSWFAETTAHPDEGQAAGDKKWQYFDDRLFSRSFDDYQDLFSYFAIKNNQSIAGKAAYASTYIYSPADQQMRLCLAGDSRLKAWLNGTKVAEFVDGKGGRAGQEFPVTLTEGWNLLLVKVATVENGRFGFYAAFSGQKELMEDLAVSPDAPVGELQVATKSLSDSQTAALPVAFREWPYEEAHAPVKPAKPGSYDEFLWEGFTTGSAAQSLSAGPFYLCAKGGTAPYSWNLGEGSLPKGLSITPDGKITGTVSDDAPLGDYLFSAVVCDKKGTVSRKTLKLTLKERPNKWFEEARLTCLMASKRLGMPQKEIDDSVDLMVKQGYQSGCFMSWNNGDYYFRWPSPFSQKKVEDDLVQRVKNSMTTRKVRFGMYLGNFQGGLPGSTSFTPNQSILVFREIMERYKPDLIWLDWAGVDHDGVDALFSLVRTISPETVIVVNGDYHGYNHGDWDSFSFEGWKMWGDALWNKWPRVYPWPKKYTPESWRFLHAGDPTWRGGLENAWKEMLRLQIALIGDGFVADIDHSFDAHAGCDEKGGPSSSEAMAAQYARMATWTSPEGKPSLASSFTYVYPSPLAAADWGYSTINDARDVIYLHATENPRGKIGLPAEASLTVGPFPSKVKSVTWMNQNQAVPFSRPWTTTDHRITIDLSKVQKDDVDTIFKIELESPWKTEPPLVENQDGTFRPATVKAVPEGNLAFQKPSRLVSTDGLRILHPNRESRFAFHGVDGDPKTVAMGAGEWAWAYEVDLERAALLDKIVLTFAEAEFPTRYRILTSFDGHQWNVAKTMSNAAGGRYEIPLTPVTARFLRIESIKPDGPGQPGVIMGIAELEAYGSEKTLP